MAGSRVFRTWAKTQNTIALSSAEAELYAIVKGNCEMLGMMTMYNDVGERCKPDYMLMRARLWELHNAEV